MLYTQKSQAFSNICMNYLQNKGDMHMAQNEAPIILDETEQKIINIIDSHRDQIIDFAKDIYTHAEHG